MPEQRTSRPLLYKIFTVFFKVGAFTFGGGFAMIPIIQREVVNNHQWISDEEFIDMIAVTQSAPGPVAVNSAVFLGFRLAGMTGALTALAGVVLPSFLIILMVAVFLTNAGQHILIQKFFAGVRPAVVALILAAGLGMGKKSLRTSSDYLVGAVSLGLLLFLNIHPILLILSGALWGAGRVYLTGHKGGVKQ